MIKQHEFAQRRQRLMDMMGGGSIAIVPASPVRSRNRDVDYTYRPDSDFYYLTGFAEPEAVMVLLPEREQGQYILFCRERDIEHEQWHGRRAGLEGACELYGADDAFPIDDMDEIMQGLLECCDQLYYAMGVHPDFDHHVLDWLNQLREKGRKGINVPKEIITLDHILHEMRLFKSSTELGVMQHVADLSAEAHRRAMQICRPDMYEYELDAAIMHEFMRHGCRHAAYPSIVGSGENACILHYIENNRQMQDGDLVLIDAGGEFDSYAADITRTFPVNGRFSPEQREIYTIVLAAQKAAIAASVAGANWDAPHQAATKTIIEGLQSLGILIGKYDDIYEEGSYRRFYMHRTGHWLGMDVHDVGDYKVDNEWRTLEKGMVMTIEPGIYIPQAEDIDPRWWNIGIRIEDDVAFTDKGLHILTADAPKEIADIEQLMSQ